MNRLLLIAVLAAGGLAGSPGAGRAAFTVTVTGLSGGSVTLNQTGTPLSGGLAGVQYKLDDSAVPGTYTFSSTATQIGGIDSLKSSLTVSTTTALTTPVTVTVTQDAYSLPVSAVGARGSMSYTNGNGAAGASYASNTGGSPLFSASFPVIASGDSGSVPFTSFVTPITTPTQGITQSFTINSLAAGGSITISATTFLDSNAVPAPAGLLAAVVGLPVLGLLRRRVRG